MNYTKKRWFILFVVCLANLCLGSIYTWSVFAAPMTEYLSGILGKTLTSADLAIAYSNVASLAKRASFEMLLIHGGHGWLLNQFFSPYFNKRKDEYGGSLENRCRLAIEVLQSVRKAVGEKFPIEFRFSGSELFDGGYDLDEGIEIAKQISPYVDLLHVSAGTYQRGFGDTHPSMFKEHGCNVYLA